MACTQALREILFLRRIMIDMHPHRKSAPTPLHVENFSAILVAINQAKAIRRKHIDIRAHHLGHQQHNNSIHLEHLPSHRNLSDILTKTLDKTAFDRLKRCLVKPPPPAFKRTLEHPGV